MAGSISKKGTCLFTVGTAGELTMRMKPEAWAVADYLIKLPDANLETRLFAAQTFKQKVTLTMPNCMPLNLTVSANLDYLRLA